MVNANSKYLVLPCWNGLHADPYFLASLHSQVCDNRGHSARVKAEYDLFFKNRYLIKWNGHLLISHLAWTTRPGEFWAWPSIYSFRKMPSFKENQHIWNHRLFFWGQWPVKYSSAWEGFRFIFYPLSAAFPLKAFFSERKLWTAQCIWRITP